MILHPIKCSQLKKVQKTFPLSEYKITIDQARDFSKTQAEAMINYINTTKDSILKKLL